MSNVEKWEDIISNSFNGDESSKERVAGDISDIIKDTSRRIFQSWRDVGEEKDSENTQEGHK